MPKPFNKSDFTPAVKDFKTGQVWTGENHREAINKAHNSGNKAVQFEGTGFLHKDGTFYTRAETEAEWGFKTSEDLR